MKIEEIVRLSDPRKDVTVEIREVVRDRHKKPHVFLRVRLCGWHFPYRAPEPFMLVGEVISTFAEITNNGACAAGYFDRPLPSARQVSFGYGRVVSWDFPVRVDGRKVKRLDRERLPREVVDPFRNAEQA